MRTFTIAALALSSLSAGPALAEEAAPPLSLDPSLSLRLGEALADEPAREPTGEPSPAADGRRPAGGYGRAGSRWLTVGAGYAYDFDKDNDFNLHAAWSTFLVDGFEFAIEGAGWYFNQQGDDTGGVSGSMVFRWHFWHADNYDWSVFTDFGIGLLAGFDEVPNGGTAFNFLPRLGLGYTRALNQSSTGESTGPRWMVGLRWHHISNARIQGDDENPARDSLMAYFALTFPL
jgi:hypothetical protein